MGSQRANLDAIGYPVAALLLYSSEESTAKLRRGGGRWHSNDWTILPARGQTQRPGASGAPPHRGRERHCLSLWGSAEPTPR